MKNKLITGRYKSYEVCYANKGQIFPRDGWYLTKGDDVIYIEDAIDQTREETIREVGDIVNKIIIKDYSKKWGDNVVDFAQDIVNRTTSLIKKELNKLKK